MAACGVREIRMAWKAQSTPAICKTNMTLVTTASIHIAAQCDECRAQEEDGLCARAPESFHA